jgi:predicted permease
MHRLLQDTRYALRWLARSPGFAAVAILSLGIGIGFNTAIFAVADALLFRPLPVVEPSRLVNIYTSSADGESYSSSSLPDLKDIRSQSTRFADIAGHSTMFAAVSGGGRARLTLGEVVTGNYFDLLGVRAQIGRTLGPDDDRPGAPRTVVVSEGYWRRELGADPAVVGRTLKIRGQAFAIVGVLDGRFTGMVPMLAPEIWTTVQYVEDVEPAGINEAVPSPTGTSRLDRRGMRWLFARARLKPGASMDDAGAELDVIAARLRAEHPATNRERRMSLRPSSQTRVHPAADGIISWIAGGTMAAVGLVLLVACANVAGMLLARASARQREIGIRLAMGAGRGRLVQQLLTESVVLGALGSAVGIALAWWITRALTTFDLPLPIPLSLDLRLDIRVLGFTAAVSVATGAVAGLAPALASARRDLVTPLKGGMPVGRAGRRWTIRDVLVVSQVAATAVLLVMAGLLLRSVSAAQKADVGFRTGGLAIVSADTGMLRYAPEKTQVFWTEAERRARALPGVQNVAFASRFPFSINFSRTNVAIPGVQHDPKEMGVPINSASVSPSYFSTLGVGIIEGRGFTNADGHVKGEVPIVVSEAMARRYWPNQSAVGRIVYERTLDSGKPMRIVGIVVDHKQQSVGEGAVPSLYTPIGDFSGFNVMMVRTAGSETAALAELRQLLYGLEPDLLLIESLTMRQQIATTLFPVRVAGTLVSVFSALTLLLAAIGLYGVLSFSVARRTREIGIRMAIGASPADVLRLVLRQGFVLVGAGLATGALLAAAATRVLSGALYGVGAADPLTWGLAGAVVLLCAAVANALPALRAAKTDPVDALRIE